MKNSLLLGNFRLIIRIHDLKIPLRTISQHVVIGLPLLYLLVEVIFRGRGTTNRFLFG